MRKSSWAGIVALASISLSATPHAAHAGKAIEWGIRAAMSEAHLSGSDYSLGGANLYSLGAGVYVDVPLTDRIGIRPEVLKITKGGWDSNGYRGVYFAPIDTVPGTPGDTIHIWPGGPPTARYAIEYLEVPVLMRYRMSPQGNFQTEFVAGPTMAFTLRSRIREVSPAGQVAALNGVRATDVGLALGAGVHIGRERVRWNIEARFTAGLSNIWQSTTQMSQHNRTLLLLTGASF